MPSAIKLYAAFFIIAFANAVTLVPRDTLTQHQNIFDGPSLDKRKKSGGKSKRKSGKFKYKKSGFKYKKNGLKYIESQLWSQKKYAQNYYHQDVYNLESGFQQEPEANGYDRRRTKALESGFQQEPETNGYDRRRTKALESGFQQEPETNGYDRRRTKARLDFDQEWEPPIEPEPEPESPALPVEESAPNAHEYARKAVSTTVDDYSSNAVSTTVDDSASTAVSTTVDDSASTAVSTTVDDYVSNAVSTTVDDSANPGNGPITLANPFAYITDKANNETQSNGFDIYPSSLLYGILALLL